MSAEAATKPVKTIGTVFKGFSQALAGALGPLGMLLNIFEALGIIQPLLDVLMAFVNILGTAFMPILIMLISVITPLIPPFQMLVEAITPLITQILSLMLGMGLLQNIMPYIVFGITYLAGALDVLMPIIMGVVGVLGPLFTDLGLLWEKLKIIWDIFKAFFDTVQNIINILGSGDPIGKIITDMFTAIGDGLESGFMVIVNWFGGIWTKIVDAIQAAWDANKEKIVEFFT